MGAERPNIVLILADDMGFSDLGCFGSEINTPNLDRLASDGLSFTSMYNCARCCPSRASLLTGQYPHRAGIGHMGVDLGTPAYQGYLREDTLTIAEALKAGGYRSLLSGKWHVAGEMGEDCEAWQPGAPNHPTPLQRGFDRFFGIIDGACDYFHPHYLVDGDERVYPEGDFHLTDAITDNAVDMVAESVADGDPFFLFLSYTAPHWPLHAREEDIAKYRGRYRDGGWDKARQERHRRLQEAGVIDANWRISPRHADAPAWDEVENRDWEDARMAVYAAQVEQMDRGIGRVMDNLTELGVAEDTLVLFLSDNGGCAEFMAEDGWAKFYPDVTPQGEKIDQGNRPEIEPGGPLTFMSYDLPWANVSNTPFRLFKHWVHEGGISTPMIVHWPARITAPRLEHAACHLIDLLPTFLDAAGVQYPEEFNGRTMPLPAGESLVPALTGRGWTRGETLFWEHEGNCAVRDGRWKLVREYGRNWELYDMVADRTELNDLSGTRGDKVGQMADRYQTWADANGVLAWQDLSEQLMQAWGFDDLQDG